MLFATGGVFLLDQATKQWVLRTIPRNSERSVVSGLFNLVHWRNTGAAFGMLHGWNGFLIVASVVTLVILWLYRRRLCENDRIRALALGAVMGGILGNLVDRVRYRAVIDFLDFFIGRAHWPAFNVADASIFLGVCVAVIVGFRTEDAAPSEGPGNGEPD